MSTKWSSRRPNVGRNISALAGVGATVAIALTVSTGATPAIENDVPSAVSTDVLAVDEPSGGPSDDRRAIADAAAAFEQGSFTTAVELAAAASEHDTVPLEGTSETASATAETGSSLEVGDLGRPVMSAIDGTQLGISFDGASTDTVIVDGALVQSNDADSTDVVTRATEHGAQMIAILADESASGRVTFSLDLPEGARLEPSDDGTVDIVRDIEVERPTASADAELDARIIAILGDTPPDSTPTDEQITALEGIPLPELEVSQETLVVASITAPWAIDADGEALATEYEVDGNTITQVVDIRGAAFPVVADPDIWWVVANSAGCLAEIVGLGLASAKAVAAFAKADKIIRAAKKLGYYYPTGSAEEWTR